MPKPQPKHAPKPPAGPAMFQTIADIVGSDAALAIVETFGGEKLEFPANPTERNRVARLIGMDKARALGDVFMGDRIPVPHAFSLRRWHRARRMRAEGETIQAIARTLICSTSFVSRACHDIPAPPRPPRMPRDDSFKGALKASNAEGHPG